MGIFEKYFERLGIRKAKVAIYAQGSVDGTNDQPLNAPITACRKYCKKQGWADIVEYVEPSGNAQSQLDRMLADLKTGGIHAIVVYTTDCLSRDRDRPLAIQQQIEQSVARLVVVVE